MIAYAIVILTDLDDVNTIEIIEVQLGGTVTGLCGDTVRSFIQCANKAYARYPEMDCLRHGLEFIPPTFRDVFAHLYEKLSDLII